MKNEKESMIGPVEGFVLEELLKEQREFIQNALKDYRLPVKKPAKGKPPERAIKAHRMLVPDPEAEAELDAEGWDEEEREQIPYIMIQVLNGSDSRGDNGQMESRVGVRFVITIYNSDTWEGRMQVLHIVQHLRRELIRKTVIGKTFELLWPLEYLIYPDETAPYHLGEISTVWSVPPVERDLPELKGLRW